MVLNKVIINNKPHEIITERFGKYFVNSFENGLGLNFSKVLWDFDGEFYETFQNRVFVKHKELCEYFDMPNTNSFKELFVGFQKVVQNLPKNYFQRCLDTLKNLKREYIYETPENDKSLGIYYHGVLFKPMTILISLYGDVLSFINSENDVIVLHIIGNQTIMYNGSLAEVKFEKEKSA
jgi:hypothetical protein